MPLIMTSDEYKDMWKRCVTDADELTDFLDRLIHLVREIENHFDAQESPHAD